MGFRAGEHRSRNGRDSGKPMCSFAAWGQNVAKNPVDTEVEGGSGVESRAELA